MLTLTNPLDGPLKGGLTASVTPRNLRLEWVWFCYPSIDSSDEPANPDCHFLYLDADTDPKVKDAGGKLRKLDGWGRGEKITRPEWAPISKTNERGRSLPICLSCNGDLMFWVQISYGLPIGGTASFKLHATLDGATSKPAVETIELDVIDGPIGRLWRGKVTFPGFVPAEIGRYTLELELVPDDFAGWTVNRPKKNKPYDKEAWTSVPTLKTEHELFVINGPPLNPGEADEVSDNWRFNPGGASGEPTSRKDGTLSGTARRFRHLFSVLGRRRPSPRLDLDWDLHVAINDKNPPYFMGTNNRWLTTLEGGQEFGAMIPLRDQWLMFAPSKIKTIKTGGLSYKSRWNDAACITHSQLHKTMLASIGLPSKVVVVIPHTTAKPKVGVPFAGDGGFPASGFAPTDDDLFYGGEEGFFPDVYLSQYQKIQRWTFTEYSAADPTKQIPMHASPVLVDAHGNFEFYEACLLTPTGRFLTGGFSTTTPPKKGFKDTLGFETARKLLEWWTVSKGRFVAWVFTEEWTVLGTKLSQNHYWDRDGNYYHRSVFDEIKKRKLQLPF